MSTNIIRQAPCPDCSRTDSFRFCETCYGSGYVPLIAKPQPSGKALLRAASLLILVFLIAVALFVSWLAGWHY